MSSSAIFASTSSQNLGLKVLSLVLALGLTAYQHVRLDLRSVDIEVQPPTVRVMW